MQNSTVTINKRIESLEKELSEARQAVLEMAPEDMLSLLQSYYLCKTRQAANIWEKTVIEKVLNIAMERERINTDNYMGQGPCPLCRSISTSPYQLGYRLPNGLLRHLSGRGHARKCVVMTAAVHLAKEFWSLELKDKT